MFIETGGYGNMGTELSKIMDIRRLSKEEMDIRDKNSVYDTFDKINPDVVVHLAALIDLNWIEKNKKESYETNVIGTRNVASWVKDNNKKMVYLSTGYVYDGEKGGYNEDDYVNPLQFYGLTKLLGEYESKICNHLIIRSVFKPRPFSHEFVPREIFTSAGYVDQIAPMIKTCIEKFSSKETFPRIINVGFKRRPLLEMARETKQVTETSINHLPIKIPIDTSFDLKLWEKMKD